MNTNVKSKELVAELLKWNFWGHPRERAENKGFLGAVPTRSF